MSIDSVVTATQDPIAAQEPVIAAAGNEADVEELLVEEVSIDGMCGVY